MRYYHIELSFISKHLYTIITPLDKYACQRLSMSFCNSPDISSKRMYELLTKLEYVRAYIDAYELFTKLEYVRAYIDAYELLTKLEYVRAYIDDSVMTSCLTFKVH